MVPPAKASSSPRSLETKPADNHQVNESRRAALADDNRSQIEMSLPNRDQCLRTLFEHAAIGIGVLETSTGQYVWCNQKYCDLLGYSHEEMTQLTFEQVTHPDDLPAAMDNLKRLVSGEISEFTVEKRYYRKDGALVWGNLSVSPNWEPGEQPLYHTAIIEDITERKWNEHALAVIHHVESQFIAS